jgi:hypothetical protein
LLRDSALMAFALHYRKVLSNSESSKIVIFGYLEKFVFQISRVPEYSLNNRVLEDWVSGVKVG